jgi:hypothetical protein
MPKILSKVIKTLITGDFFLNLGWGFLSPVFAIFILEKISNHGIAAAAEVAGLAALFYWIPKSFFQIPIGIYLDKNHGEKDDFWFMWAGLLITALVPAGYIFSSVPWHIYLLQVIYAAGMAMYVPSWMAIFIRHTDKGKEAFEYGTESTLIGTGVGVAGGLSGIFVAMMGFRALFIFVSATTILSAILLLSIRNKVFLRDGHSNIFAGEKTVVGP